MFNIMPFARARGYTYIYQFLVGPASIPPLPSQIVEVVKVVMVVETVTTREVASYLGVA